MWIHSDHGQGQLRPKCLEHLAHPAFYTEVQQDPNPDFNKVANAIHALFDQGHIDERQKSHMLQGDRTPAFYGLPKMHKQYDLFPELRPICSGSGCCSVRLSEFVDSFLKKAAQTTSTFIKDTTDFINKIRSYHRQDSLQSVYLVTIQGGRVLSPRHVSPRSTLGVSGSQPKNAEVPMGTNSVFSLYFLHI